jgi:hypothetical protein
MYTMGEHYNSIVENTTVEFWLKNKVH